MRASQQYTVSWYSLTILEVQNIADLYLSDSACFPLSVVALNPRFVFLIDKGIPILHVLLYGIFLEFRQFFNRHVVNAFIVLPPGNLDN